MFEPPRRPTSLVESYTLEDDPDELERDQLVKWLEANPRHAALELQRPPAAALEVLALSRKANVRLEDLAALLEREPMLAGRVLRLANSAMYGGVEPCPTLRKALIRLGLNRVREVVMEAAFMMTVVRAEGLSTTLDAIRRHSAAVAWLARLIARQTSFDAENAFLVGLLHDVGLSSGLLLLREFLLARKAPVELTELRWSAVEQHHTVLTGAVLEAWGLPGAVRLIGISHHTLMFDGRPHPIVAIVILAEHLAYDRGWGATPRASSGAVLNEGIERPGSEARVRALATLGFDERVMASLGKDADATLKTLATEFHES